jgi:lipoprotein NlpD
MRAASIALLLLVAGCGGSSSSLIEYEPRVHIVQPGETLLGIAWNYGLDHRDLARWNRLDNPDFIRAGQRLRLTPQPNVPAAAAPSSSPRAAAPSAAARPPAPSAGPRQTAAPPPPPASPPPQWHWPTAGTVVSRFGTGEGVSTGVGIAGVHGQAIEAAADGSVVYAGSGLIGYGQLVIIRHNDTFLTAYGYNSRLLVEQGQAVARGQRIAEMGLGPARQPRLHFEIRRNGVPVDPLQFFAAR